MSDPATSPASSLPALIIGGGPAGCACALWLHKLGVNSLLIEASDRLGGLQRLSPYENLWIPGVQGRTGEAVAAALHAHIVAGGVPHRLNTAVTRVETADGFTVITKDQSFRARHLVLATGTRPAAGPFRPSPNVAIGPGHPMEALRVEGQRIAILGGGDNALDQARFVLQRGAAKVTIFSRSRLRAQPLLQQMIPQADIRIGPYAADQDRLSVNGEPFDAFGVMYGFEAHVPPGLSVCNAKGYVEVDRHGETATPGLWACGDVTDYWHPCVTTSAAHGIQVAKQISLRLQ
ncbi:NAD(P)/FAD-dependent oxidoreductase [Asticcacaulis sp.]|uniref:NAD(P)/FAD-dependent oxidoreductase n=1 Tax=Asticcacaulis sp. TaxID=1872648 RepID=UPI0031D05684